MNIKEILTERTNDKKEFDRIGKNWFIIFKFDSDKQFGIELKPEMGLQEIVFELIKFTNLLIKNLV